MSTQPDLEQPLKLANTIKPTRRLLSRSFSYPRPRARSRSSAHQHQPASELLPLPAVAVAADDSGSGSGRKKVKNARIETSGLRVHWARFKQRLGTGSALSESLLDGGGESSETTGGSSWKVRGKARASTGVGRSGGGILTDKDKEKEKENDGEEEEGAEVDEVVVDNVLDEHSVTQPSEMDGRIGAVPGSHPGTDDTTAPTHATEGIWEQYSLLVFLRWRLWPAILSFFAVQFFEPDTEMHYRREVWFTSKSLAMWAGTFFVFNWILACIFVTRPLTLGDKVFYFAFAPLLSVPIPILIIFNVPRERPILYQTYLTFGVWAWCTYQVVDLYMCGFYGQRPFTCGSRDFLGLFYYATGLPAVALFGLRATRISNLTGALVFFILNCILVVPFRHNWVRNLLNFLCFHSFILYIHYKRETSERRLYSLRDQLKIQFRATQKAQVNERKAADSKRRLTSYVFHEVRVPLNTAMLAVQNMAATGTLAMEQEIEWAALEGSLTMMSKVLNDVLDFNRMDSGRFSTVDQPYSFHQAIRSMLVPLKLAADARGLALDTELDKGIDEVARKAVYLSQNRDEEWIARRLAECPDEEGMVLGDEMRLRQIITNLTSNACKFTPTGGSIKVVTKLLHPERSVVPVQSDVPGTEIKDGLSTSRLSAHNSAPPERIVCRVEVHDTGVGIKAKDLVDNRLFSPYVQTEIGKYQGGKGTGLGLALVRRIVKLSGGRLGVKSKLGEGSIFWVELPLGVGSKVVMDLAKTGHRDSEGTNSSGAKFTRDRAILFDTVPYYKFEIQRTTPASDLTAVERQMGIPSLASSPDGDPVLQGIMDQSGPFEMDTRRHLSEVERSAALLSHAPKLPSVHSSVTEKLPATSPPDSPPAQTIPVFMPAFSTSDPSLTFDKGLSVLVVDDDPLTRNLMQRMLTRLGCAVETAENGKVALDKILGEYEYPTSFGTDNTAVGTSRSTPSSTAPPTPASPPPKYGIVFLDNQMPIMSGLDTVMRLRELGRTDLVVGVTGNALLSDQQEYLEAGVDSVLTKPVHERSLKAMLALADRRLKEPQLPSSPPEES